MIAMNSPLNPTGTVIDSDQLRGIATLIVEENERRNRGGAKPVYLVFDQVYRKLTFGDAVHVTPIALVPEIAPYTILIDAISKSFCATGLRVGWGFMPPGVRRRMGDILGHVGAWAPKPEQIATAALIEASDAMNAFQSTMKGKIKERLDALYAGFTAMKREGLPVDAIAPQGALYLSVHFDLIGKTVRDRSITTNEDIRRLLLHEAGLAIVPFQAFGLKEESGWFRLSVGGVSMADIEAAFPRLLTILQGVSR